MTPATTTPTTPLFDRTVTVTGKQSGVTKLVYVDTTEPLGRVQVPLFLLAVLPQSG